MTHKPSLPPEAVSPRWVDDPFYWTYFVPEDYRRTWRECDEDVKKAVYDTAIKACEHLRGSGVFDD